MQAIEAEAMRQIEVWESGGEVEQETRLFDTGRGETRSLRSKEDAHDYRYFPDPDLLPLVLDEGWVARAEGGAAGAAGCQAAPASCSDYGLVALRRRACWSRRRRRRLSTRPWRRAATPKLAANWVMGDFFAALNRTGRSIEDSPVSAAALGKLLDLLADKTINGRIAKEVFEAMVETGAGPGRHRRGARPAPGDRHWRDRRARSSK